MEQRNIGTTESRVVRQTTATPGGTVSASMKKPDREGRVIDGRRI